jgi:hypothetical protein
MRRWIDYCGARFDLYINSFVREIDPTMSYTQREFVPGCVLNYQWLIANIIPLVLSTLTLKYQYPTFKGKMSPTDLYLSYLFVHTRDTCQKMTLLNVGTTRGETRGSGIHHQKLWTDYNREKRLNHQSELSGVWSTCSNPTCLRDVCPRCCLLLVEVLTIGWKDVRGVNCCDSNCKL